MRSINRKLWTNKYVVVVVILRVSGYIYMLYRPFEGMLISILFDILDWFILSFGKLPLKKYHEIDKPLDYLQYVFLIPILFHTPIFKVYLLLLGWRTIGYLLSLKLRTTKTYLFFPNFGEYVALIYFTIEKFSLKIDVYSMYILVPLVIGKFCQEYWIHFKSYTVSYSWGEKLRYLLLNKLLGLEK
ncbi:hypothetical protein IT417_02195 [bacterium]|nr:hypothetical protein [bacterium]